MSMAYRKGLISVTYCRNTGMLLTGVVRPDKSENGMINNKENSIACCIVAETDDSSSPMPTAASKNTLNPAYKVKNDPANGIRNQSCATNSTIVACTIPTRIDGKALPTMISTGRNGVTSN